jgi:hypothetical protein
MPKKAKPLSAEKLLKAHTRRLAEDKLKLERSEFRAKQAVDREALLVAASRSQHRNELDRLMGGLQANARAGVPHVMERIATLRRSVPVYHRWLGDVAPPL